MRSFQVVSTVINRDVHHAKKVFTYKLDFVKSAKLASILAPSAMPMDAMYVLKAFMLMVIVNAPIVGVFSKDV